MSDTKLLLESAVSECRKHISRLDYSYSSIKSKLPFSPQIIETLSNEDTALIDQYVYRFSKLQDTIGNKLFRAVLLNLGEEVYNKSMIDIFNRLEQLGYVANYETWKQLREIRNEVSHNYDDDPAAIANTLNLIFSHKDTLVFYFKGIEGKLV